MDRLRTLLLARTSTVVLDPDSVAGAATRPSRDVDLDRFEDELAQLGFVMSLDLAMTVRRLPNQTVQDLKTWILATLATTVGAHRPHVPLFSFPAGVPANTRALYLRRVLSWLFTRPEQPCPWCGQVKTVGALDPCGHLVCRSCWDGGNYAGCPICHRRIAVTDPFITPAPDAQADPIQHETGQLRLVDLAFDAITVARERFERLLARVTPLSTADREEVETVIDVIGPKAAIWIPSNIAVKETMAIVIARLWMVAPDRALMVKATQGHVRTATDALRVAAVLMGADPALVEPLKFTSIGRGLRRSVLQALERLPPAQLLEDFGRHVGLWKRVGEVLHPFELARKLPNVALAFALVRDTDVAATTFAAELRTHASALGVSVEDRVHVRRWAGPVEDALRAGDARAAIARLAERPGELLRRVDHVMRVACARQPDAFDDVLRAIRQAVPRGAPATLLALGSHVRARVAPWSRRIVFPKGQVLKAWAMPDLRPPLRADAIGAIVDAVRGELVARAEKRKPFARAVIDRGLADLLVPSGERAAKSQGKVAWPRGSEAALPASDVIRLFLHWEEPPRERVDLDLSIAFYNADWRLVHKCDFTNLVVGERAAVHSGDLTSAAAPLGASEFIDLDLPALAALGARHAVMVVFGYNAVPFDRLTHGFAGLMVRPQGEGPFDPRAVMQRFDLSGRSPITLPLTIDLETRRMRWIDVHVSDRDSLYSGGGYNATLAHVGHDFADFVGTGARPTMWDVAAIHAAARANVIYVRERDGSISTVRRREGESALTRLARLYHPDDDSQLSRIPHADAPTWFAVLRDDLTIPKGSAGYVLDARAGDGLARLSAADLVAELATS